MNNKELITKWVLEKVEEEYKDDIALVVSHNTLRLESEKGNSLSKLFYPNYRQRPPVRPHIYFRWRRNRSLGN